MCKVARLNFGIKYCNMFVKQLNFILFVFIVEEIVIETQIIKE